MKTQKLVDVFGKAIQDYYDGINAVIQTYSSIGGWDELPVEYLFRSFEKMPELEQTALELSYGKILDLGCGAGSHSLYLQDKKHKVIREKQEERMKYVQYQSTSSKDR